MKAREIEKAMREGRHLMYDKTLRCRVRVLHKDADNKGYWFIEKLTRDGGHTGLRERAHSRSLLRWWFQRSRR